MGGMLSHPVTDKRSNEGEGLGLRYGLCSMQGWRSEMEDAHDVKIGLKYGLEDWSYFAVFDGHAGKRAAAFAAWNLLEFILRDSQFRLDTDNLPEHVCIEPDLEKLHDIIRVENTSGSGSGARGGSSNQLPESEQPQDSGWERTSKSLEATKTTSDQRPSTDVNTPSKSSATQEEPTSSSSLSPSSPTTVAEADKTKEVNKQQQQQDGATTNQSDNESVPNLSKFNELPVLEQLELVKSAIRSGFLRIDQSMRDTAQDMSGCTAVCTLISSTHLFIANCGDSRAVLFDGSPKFATEDHKPLNPKERMRIIKAGGSATQRINGTLAVSRALGDFEFKKDQQRGPCEQLVSPEPEVTVIQRHPTDEFLILACDGIWDVMESWSLCEFVSHKLKVEPNLKKVCSSVLDVCLHKGSRDNMSIIIVVFENGPKFSEAERERDLKNDEHIAEAVREFGEKQDDFNEFFYRLKDRYRDMRRYLRDISAYFPPGAGLEGKFDLLRDMYEKEFEFKSDDEE